MTADPLPVDALVADLGRMVAELDALRELEQAVRFRTRSDLDWHGLDGGLHVEEHVWHRERQLLAALDRIREETP